MVEYIQGLNSDRVVVNGKELHLGYDCSSTRKSAAYAHDDCVKAKQFGWKSCFYIEKPFVGDLLGELEPAWREEDWSGYNIFMGRDITTEEANQLRDFYIKESEKERI